MLDAAEVIERLCELQEKVTVQVTGYDESADCFCGKGGFWRSADYGGTFEKGYRNSGAALKFIEDAVQEKIERERPIAEEKDDD